MIGDKEKILVYDSILARSFSRYEQKKLGYGAFVCCLLIAFAFCAFFKPYFIYSLPPLNLQLGAKMLLRVNETSGFEIQRAKTIDERRNAEMVMSMKLAVANDSDIRDDQIRIKNGTRSSSMAVEKNTSSSGDDRDLYNKETASYQIPSSVNKTSSSQRIVQSTDTNITKNMNPVLVCSSEPRSDFCEIVNGDIRIHAKSSTVYISSSSPISTQNSSWFIKPYARKNDETAMSRVREWLMKTEKNTDQIPPCTKAHKAPAILFSLGGYSGNNFHDFTDIIIPLFLTSRHFNGEVQFLVTNLKSGWIPKFREVIENLSKYPVIDIDKEEDQTHCFTTAIVGLKRHGRAELMIDRLKTPYSMEDFRAFLRSVYSLPAITTAGKSRKKPRLLIISRKKTRTFSNPDEISRLARNMGFEVIVSEADVGVARFAELVNSCDVMMGVHGAGLTNMVFLPENAILIQILPIGGFDWLGNFDFGGPSKEMKLRYLEYKIKMEESTLIQQFPVDHQVMKNPSAILKQGWEAFRSVYLVKQNVNLDVSRFKRTLLKALELLNQ